MEKKLHFCLAVFFMAMNLCALYAVDPPVGKIKNYHINQTFDEITVLPTGWSYKSGSEGLVSIKWADGAIDAKDGNFKISNTSSQNNTLGGDLIFPSPQSNDLFQGEKKFYLEVDWTPVTVNVDKYNRANLFLVSGSGSKNLRSDASYYIDAIFGLYTCDNEYIYYCNQDLQGPVTATPGEYYGPAFISGGYPNFHRTPAVNKGLIPTGITDDSDGMKALNAAGKTTVTFTAGSTYHIYAELNFESQKVETLIITEVGNEINTQTINNQPFMNNDWRNWDCSKRPDVKDCTVDDIAVISSVQTRRSQNPTMETRFDNIEIYTLVADQGQTDVTVQFIDQNDDVIKTRIEKNLNIGQICELRAEDKNAFSENGFYYAYDAEGTKSKNPGGYGDGYSVMIAPGSVLYVKYLKTAVTTGDYVWTGATNRYWSELDANFTVNGVGPIPYQPGNRVVFSTDAVNNDTVFVRGLIPLGEADVEVSGKGYTFVNDTVGINALVGSGQFIVETEAVLGFDNQMSELVVSGTHPVTFTQTASGVAAQKVLMKADNACLLLKSWIGMPVAYAESVANGTLNIEVHSDNGCGSAFTNVSTLNVKLAVPGRLHNSSWTTSFSPYLDGTLQPYNGMKINVTNICESYTYPVEGVDVVFDKPIVGFGLQDLAALNASVHLGDGVRLVRTYNESANGSWLQIGELTGTENSSLHLGWVGGRAGYIQVGNLNTDHTFHGKIEKFYQFFSPENTIASRAGLVKVGTGKWSLSNDVLLDNGITVNGGELEMSGDVSIGIGAVNVNNGGQLTVAGEFGVLYGNDAGGNALTSIVTTTTVNQGGILKTLRGSKINSLKTTIGSGGTLMGDFNGLYDLTLESGLPATEGIEAIPAAVWKPTVSSFSDGDFDRLFLLDGGFDIRGDFDITVESSDEGEKISLLESGASNYSITLGTVKVNGEEIPMVNLANEETVPGNAKYAWLFDPDFGAYEFLSQTRTGSSGIDKINVGKEIRSIQYFDLFGRQVPQNTNGFVLLKITYADDSTDVKKVYIHKR